jgi:hypothetical protein
MKKFDASYFASRTVTQGPLQSATCCTCGKTFIVGGNGPYWHWLLHGDFSYTVDLPEEL